MNDEHILHLEEISMNAWACFQTLYDDGWILRFAEGYTGRANSVNMLHPSTDDIETKIDRCQAQYTRQGLDTLFKLTSAELHRDIDQRLERRGYTIRTPTSVQTVDLNTLAEPTHLNISLLPELTDEWLHTYTAMRGVESKHINVMRHMLNSIVPAKCFAMLHHEGEIVAMGLSVAEREYIGLFDIVTAEHMRNRGFARQILLHLMQWGKSNGAQQAYLQVMTDNPSAVHLYASLGFCEVYQYWYRLKRL